MFTYPYKRDIKFYSIRRVEVVAGFFISYMNGWHVWLMRSEDALRSNDWFLEKFP